MEVSVKKAHALARDTVFNARIASILVPPASNLSPIVSLVSIILLLREIPALSTEKATFVSGEV